MGEHRRHDADYDGDQHKNVVCKAQIVTLLRNFYYLVNTFSNILIHYPERNNPLSYKYKNKKMTFNLKELQTERHYFTVF